jgi:hypothetical protein
MADQEINIKLNGIAAIRAELKALKGELANATDPAQMEKLAEKAGALSDKLKDANEKAAVFASGSKFEQTSNAFSLMSSQLMSMDFEGASESAKLFAGNLGKIDGKTISSGIKAITSMVTMLGGAFIRLGIQILANPLFLLIAVIVAIVAAIVIFGKNLGFVKKIIAALGAVLDAIIAGLKAMSDWMGLSSYAAQDSAKKQVAAMKEVDKARETQLNNFIRSTEMTIKLQQIEGKDTFQLEMRKREAIIETSRTRYHAALEQIAMMRQTGEADQEEIKKLYEKAKAMRETIDKESADMRVAYAQRKQDKKKAAEDEQKSDEQNAKTAAENAKKWRADRLSAERQIDDLRMSLIKDDQERELAINTEKYKRLRYDLLTNEKLTKDERKKLNDLYIQESIVKEEELRKKYEDIERNKQIAIAKTIKDAQLLRAQEEEDFATLYDENTRSRQQLEEDAVREKYFNLIEQAKQYGLDTQELERRQQEEITKIQDEAAADARKKRQQEFEEKMQIAEKYAKSVNNLTETVFTLSNRFGKQDEESKEKRAKRQFQVQKAMQLSMAIMDGYKAVTTSLSMSPIAIGPVPNPAGIASLAFAVSTSLANVAKIAATQYETKSSSGGAGGAGAASGGGVGSGGNTGGTPSFSLFGQGNNMNTTSQPTDKESNLTVKAVVVESDITSTQNKVKKMQENATL